jgi:hypothetical protein
MRLAANKKLKPIRYPPAPARKMRLGFLQKNLPRKPSTPIATQEALTYLALRAPLAAQSTNYS